MPHNIDDIRQYLQSRYTRLSVAYLNRDQDQFLHVWQEIALADCIIVIPNRPHQTASEFSASNAQMFPNILSVEKHEFTIEKIHVNDDENIGASVVLHVLAIILGESNQPQHREMRVRDYDTWRQTPDGWKMTRSERIDLNAID